MRTQQENEKYLYNLATTMIQQLRIRYDYEIVVSCGAKEIYEKYGPRINARLSGMSPETRGRIADLGLSRDYDEYEPEEIPLQDVHHSDQWLDNKLNGRNLIEVIACTTIVAKIAEVLWKDLLSSAAPQSAAEEEAEIRARDPID